jgi:uncharacterized RDD family membrane protein YckC
MKTLINKQTSRTVPLGVRLGTMLLDHAIISLTVIPVVIALQYISNPEKPLVPSSPYQFMPLFVVYFCKDIIGGRSPAKRMLNLSVIDNSSLFAASPLQCLIRNLFVILWPIEVLVAFFNQQQRIGDRLAGTRLSYFDSNTHVQPKWLQITIAILTSTLLSYLTIALLYGF